MAVSSTPEQPEITQEFQPILDRHVAELQMAEERGAWRGRVEQRLDGHDREFAELRGTMKVFGDEQKRQGGVIGDLHTTQQATLTAAQAIQDHVTRQESDKWSARQLIIGVSLSAAGFASVIAAILALVIH